MSGDTAVEVAQVPELSIKKVDEDAPRASDAIHHGEAQPSARSSPDGERDQVTATSEAAPSTINGSAKVPESPNVDSAQKEETADTPNEKRQEPSELVSAIPKPVTTPGKKSTPGSAKKRSSGVPEHRSRKLNKKKSKPALHLNADPGALFLARMKGHQPWPSIICDEDMLPSILIQTRPVTAAQADGSFKKVDYAQGGKRENERSFPVMFLFTNEFAWIPNTELTPITPTECAEAVEKQKSKTLAAAYSTASEGHDLAHFKHVLSEHQDLLAAEAEAKVEREAKKSEKATKQKRKSEAAVPATDKMELDDDTQGKTKKRKKDAAIEDEGKPAKTQKTGTTKLKLNMTPKGSGADSASKKKTPKPRSTGKKTGGKAAEAEDETPQKPQDEVLSPKQLLEKREKEVRYIRHKLQKGFLSRDTVPDDGEIETMSTYLSKVEAHPDLDGSILRATKIHKVLKAMIRLDSIPKDDIFHFKQRSRSLLEKWTKILASDSSASAEKDDDTKPETLVDSKDEGINDKQSGAQGDTREQPVAVSEETTKDATVNDEKANGNKDKIDKDAPTTQSPNGSRTTSPTDHIDALEEPNKLATKTGASV